MAHLTKSMVFSPERFRKLRLKSGLTQGEVAQMCGTTRFSIHRWETDGFSSEPKASQLPVLCHLFKVEANAFFVRTRNGRL